MKEKWKKSCPHTWATIAATLCAPFVFTAFLLRPEPLQVGSAEPGCDCRREYIGVCQNKILFAVVQVEIQDREIVNIEVIEHKTAYMAQAKQIAEGSDEQSLKVDAISGATLTSDTVLKGNRKRIGKDRKL